ncbi:spore coat protein GerQ [Psychrobacillus sp. BL-248-WT-3]|uniref:spore coat protein GerQ n=1 Tax=Psychrobacillus sp. BL-248-WT-3 TaxID=2725306 RepID=UPI00146DBE37|nr:spore coat protein GerQ [Psychrobacillus sp. BL-248-WT-3]NME07694.1 spore coat protein GerQ [Psychrobacillus sp. BL-248-WT-3]
MVQYYWYPGAYPNQQFPQQAQQVPGQQPQQQQYTPGVQIPASGRQEESYVENILRLNRGKLGTFYFTFENNATRNNVVLNGYVEAAGRDHVIISDQNGKRYLMLMIYFDYATFDEEINYF